MPVRISIDQESLKAVIAKLEALAVAVDTEVIQELNLIGEEVRTDAVQRAPVYTGKPNKRIIPGLLRSSAFTAYTSDGRHMAVVGFNTVYARRQHEEITWRHVIGEAKYLENAWLSRIGTFGPRVEKAVHRAMAEVLR